MQGLSKQTGIAAADACREKRLHLPETVRQLGSKRTVVVIKPPITLHPSTGLLSPKLFTEIFTDKRMSIETPRIVRIFSCEKFRSS
jgi:hypothetical protein